MKLLIKIEHPKIILQLLDEKRIVDEKSWTDQNDMSKKLLEAIDKILAKNKIEVQELAGIEVESDQQSYTSTRIAQAVAKTVGYCLA